jgi:hypothetical protein
MATDNLNRDFVYISKRLLRDLYKQHMSDKRGAGLDTLLAAGFGAGGRLKTAQPDNEYWLVRQVTEAVRDNTGTLLQPGRYVKCTLMTTWAAIPFMREGTTVAWLEATADTDEGPAFLALCGSLSNLRGSRPDELRGGWFPSSAGGLTQIVRAFGRGNNDPRRFIHAGDDELAELFTVAYGLARSPTATYRIDTRELEILFEVFYSEDDLTLNGVRYRRTFFGTPVWAATPEPQPLEMPPRDGGAATIPGGAVHIAHPARRKWQRWTLGNARRKD